MKSRCPIVLASAAALAVLLGTTCVSETNEASLRPLTLVLDIEPGQADRVRPAAIALAREMGLDASVSAAAAETAGPRVTVSGRRPDGDSVAAPLGYWGAFAFFWSPAESISLDALRSAARGEPVDWSAFASPRGAVSLYLPAGQRNAVEQMLGSMPAEGPNIRWLPLGELTTQAVADPLGLALLPVEAAGPRLRSVAVDGIDLVRGVGDAAASPLMERVWVSWKGDGVEAYARALAKRIASPAPTPIRVVATGDIIPARCVYARQRALNDYSHAFRPTADYLRAADLTLGSLDATLSDAGEPVGCVETLNLLAPARSAEGLAFAGFDVITLATNHDKDCGLPGGCGDRAILDTLANLRAAGVQPVGAGEDREAAHRPAIVTVKGIRFAVLGYDDIAPYYNAGETSAGSAALESATLARDVAEARQRADVVIVMDHWGTEYTEAPTQRQVDLGRAAIDDGASLVVGNHPHVVQAVEWRADGFVAYALGNFVFDQDWSTETQQGAVLEATYIGAKLVGVRLLPIRIVDMHQPVWAQPAEGRSILERMRAASEALPR